MRRQELVLTYLLLVSASHMYTSVSIYSVDTDQSEIHHEGQAEGEEEEALERKQVLAQSWK